MAVVADMSKEGDAGDAVSAKILGLHKICLLNFAHFCKSCHGFAIFLHIFAWFCAIFACVYGAIF